SGSSAPGCSGGRRPARDPRAVRRLRPLRRPARPSPRTGSGGSWSPRSGTVTPSPRSTVVGTSPSGTSWTGATRDGRVRRHDPRGRRDPSARQRPPDGGVNVSAPPSPLLSPPQLPSPPDLGD